MNTDAETHVNGTVTADGTAPEPSGAPFASGDVSVTADSEQEADEVDDDTLVGDDFWTPAVHPVVGNLSQLGKSYAVPLGNSALDLLKSILPTFGTWLETFVKSPGLFDSLENFMTTGFPSKIGGAASIAIADVHNTANAEVGSTAVIKARGKVTVNATINDPYQALAATSLYQPETDADGNPESTDNVASVAVALGIYQNTATASIDAGAVVNGTNGVAVDSTTTIPYDDTFIDYQDYNDASLGSAFASEFKLLMDHMNGNLGVQNGLFTNWAQSAGYGTSNTVAGSVDLVRMDNTTTATIGAGALVNQDPEYRPAPGSTDKQDVTVDAETDYTTTSISGLINVFANLSPLVNPVYNSGYDLTQNPFGASGTATGEGGSVLLTGYDDTTTATIDAGAKVHADDLDVNATTDGKAILMAVSGSKAPVFAASGAASIDVVSDTTTAQVDPTADLDVVGDATVNASDFTFALNIGGDVVEGRQTGAGISSAINVVSRDTEASISPTSVVPPGTTPTAAIEMGGNLQVEAENSGPILAIGLSGAYVSNSLPTGADADSDGQNATNLKQSFSIFNLPGVPGLAKNVQPNSGFGLAGDAVANVVVDTTEAYIDIPSGTVAVTGSTTIEASNPTDLISIAGAGALVTNAKSDAGIGGSFASDVLNGGTDAYLEGAGLLRSSSLDIDSDRSGIIVSLTAAAGASPEAGSGIAGDVSVNVVLQTTTAYVSDTTIDLVGTASATVGTASVTAEDTAEIWAVGGALGYGSSGGYGVSIAVNLIGTDNAPTATTAYISGSVLGTSGGTVTVSASDADSTADPGIYSLAGAAGIATGEKADADGAGMVGVNIIFRTAEAYVQGSTFNGVGGTTGLEVEAEDDNLIDAIGGAVAAGMGNGIGAAFGYNEIHDTTSAGMDTSTATVTGPLTIDAESDSRIVGADIGAAAGLGDDSLTAGGSVTVNVIDGSIDAYLTGATVTASGDAAVTASDNATIVYVAGGVAGTVGDAAAGVAIGYNLIQEAIQARVENSNLTLNGGASDLRVSATSDPLLVALVVGAAGSDEYAIGGSVAVNSVDDTLDAHISDDSYVMATGSVYVTAPESARLIDVSGGLGVAPEGTAAVGAAIAYNYMGGGFDGPMPTPFPQPPQPRTTSARPSTTRR